MACQMFIADQTIGALYVYAKRPHAFDQSSKDIGRIIAAHSVVAWNTAPRRAIQEGAGQP